METDITTPNDPLANDALHARIRRLTRALVACDRLLLHETNPANRLTDDEHTYWTTARHNALWACDANDDLPKDMP